MALLDDTAIPRPEREALTTTAKRLEGTEVKFRSALTDVAADLKRNLWPDGTTREQLQARLDTIVLRERDNGSPSFAAQFGASKATLALLAQLYPADASAYFPPYEFVAYMESGGRLGAVVVPVAYDPARPAYPVQADRAAAEAFADEQA